MVQAIERINPDNYLDDNGDVRSEADFIDAEGNLIDVPEPRVLGSVSVQPAPEVQPVAPAEQDKDLLAKQERWDDLFGDMLDIQPSNYLARAEMVRKYGERPVASAEVSTQNDSAKPSDVFYDAVAIASLMSDPIFQRKIDHIRNHPIKSDAAKEREIAELVARRRAHIEVGLRP